MNAHSIHTTRSLWVPDQNLVSVSQELATSPPIIAIRPLIQMLSCFEEIRMRPSFKKQ